MIALSTLAHGATSGPRDRARRLRRRAVGRDHRVRILVDQRRRADDRQVPGDRDELDLVSAGVGRDRQRCHQYHPRLHMVGNIFHTVDLDYLRRVWPGQRPG